MTSIEPKLRKALTGISGILVTPFDVQDEVAPARLRPIIDRAIRAGVHILVANGNTGEFYGLTTAEAEEMVHSVAEQIAGRVPLLAGVGRSINDACKLARASRAAGATALMVHQPPDPFVSPRALSRTCSGLRKPAMVFRSCCTFATMALVSMLSSNCAKFPALLASSGPRRLLYGSRKRSVAGILTSSGLAAWLKLGLRRSAQWVREVSHPA